MKISFYEEFPTRENLEKLRLIDFPTQLYVAAHSLREFYSIRDKIKKNQFVEDVGYWLVLSKEEGYWLSPFCRREALARTINELKGNKKELTVMWDAELPFMRPHLFITQLPGFFAKRRLIRDFIKNSQKYKIKIVTSEYAAPRHIGETFLRILGVKFGIKEYKHKKIIMFYSSMFKTKTLKRFITLYVRREKKRYGERVSVALGTIDIGILGDEPILSPQQLDRDLALMKKIGIEEVVIFRLGGLNEEYIKVIKKYL
jgi:hypothetical protein